MKTYTHSTMISERLNGLALIHAYQEIVPDIEKVTNLLKFGSLVHTYVVSENIPLSSMTPITLPMSAFFYAKNHYF